MFRLERYIGNYNGKFRLYKLHGNLDYELFYRIENGTFVPDGYTKSRYGIGHTNQFKEANSTNGEMSYQNRWINCHSDFLTETTSKINRYNEPLLFNKLIDEFRKNLENSEKLIIIGYGGSFIETAESFLEELNSKIHELEEGLKKSSDEVKKKSKEILDELNERKEIFQSRLDEVKADTGELWMEVLQWFIE